MSETQDKNSSGDLQLRVENKCIKSKLKNPIKSHRELCNLTEKILQDVLSDDDLMRDIPFDASIEEVLSQIAVAQGRSITVFVYREDLPTLKVVVPEKHTTVLDLKKAIRRTYELEQRRQIRREYKHTDGCSTKNLSHTEKANISWRYVWRTYLLQNEKQTLLKDNQLLSSYGVVNKSKLKFIKRAKFERSQKC